ncbi:MAG: PKD domain-containing protein [Methanoregula sp.]|jgi:PKD repeat protein|uniref:PKD domain-containing protein n=1 Tax=Methanoregula sp. TaxID=2052170 RepID=UPI003D0BE5B4
MKRSFPRIKKRVLIAGILFMVLLLAGAASFFHLLPGPAALARVLEPRAPASPTTPIGGMAASLSVPLQKPLIADFSGSRPDLYTPLTMKFLDLSRGDPVTWYWDFGDNSTSDSRFPVHQYASPGSYNVTLTVTRGDGAPQTVTQNTAVGDGIRQEHTVLLDTLRRGVLKKGSYLVFVSDRDDTSVTIAGQRINLPNGSVVKLRADTDSPGNVTIRYGNLLAFSAEDATLFVNGSQAATGVAGDCDVTGPASARANLSFGIIPTEGEIRQLVIDGEENLSGEENSQIDLSLDTADIRSDLTLVGFPAFYEGKADSISLSPALIADFSSGPPDEGLAPFNVSFRDRSVGIRENKTTWSWDFGDGSTSSERDPVHQYQDPGSYSINLTVHSGDQTDSRTRENAVIVDSPQLVADFNGTPLTGAAPLKVRFQDHSSGSPWWWNWSFGPNATPIYSNDPNPVVEYDQPGVYPVWLSIGTVYASSDAFKTGYVTVTDPYMLPLQDIVVKTGKQGIIRKDSNIQFVISDSPATIGMNGGFREIPKGAVVRIVAQEDQSGDIHIDSGKILKFSFPDMALYIDGDLVSEGRIDSIYIPYMRDFNTALTYYFPPASARTLFIVDGSPILNDLDNAWIQINSLGMNAQGSLSLISSDNSTMIDGAANQTIHDWYIQ